MLTITVRRCVWCINDGCGHHWSDIYRYAILMRANKPEIQIGGSSWCLTDVDLCLFDRVTGPRPMCWRWGFGVGLCPMGIWGVLVTLHMFWLTRRSHHVPSVWMVCIRGNNCLGGRQMDAICGLCGFTVWDIICGYAHHNSQEVRLMYKWWMWSLLVRYLPVCCPNERK